MTTADLAVAEAFRLQWAIYRQPAGWQTPVTVQEWAPNTPRYSWANMGPVDHCGLSMNAILHNIGLVMEVDFPNCAWTPTAYYWCQNSGRGVPFEAIEPGDLLLFRNPGSEYAATHIGMATSRWDGGVSTIEYNTDTTGYGREYWRTPGYLVAAGRPAYRPAPVTPEPVQPPTIKDLFTRRPILATAPTL